MPTLNWIGKDKVVGHHNDVPYHVLEHQYGYSAEKGQTTEPTHSGNMIIHGEVFLMGVNRLTVNSPKMHTTPHSHIIISIYIYIYII